jgi:hypothetical protein
MRREPIAWIAAALALSSEARGHEPQLDAGAAIAWAFPVGAAEEGTELSDATVGLVPITIDLEGRVAPRVGIGLLVRYGVGIPTMCGSAGECTASLGSDVLLAARARFVLPDLGPISPRAGVGLGWEWLATRFADEDARASRLRHGPVPLVADVELALTPAQGWTVGLVGGAALGVFVDRQVDTAYGSASVPAADLAPHAFIDIGVRVGAAW